MKIDDTNIQIIKHLRSGRKSYKKIAAELGITQNTVRSRVNKLVEEGVIEISGFANPEVLPGHRVVMVGVQAADRSWFGMSIVVNFPFQVLKFLTLFQHFAGFESIAGRLQQHQHGRPGPERAVICREGPAAARAPLDPPKGRG